MSLGVSRVSSRRNSGVAESCSVRIDDSMHPRGFSDGYFCCSHLLCPFLTSTPNMIFRQTPPGIEQGAARLSRTHDDETTTITTGSVIMSYATYFATSTFFSAAMTQLLTMDGNVAVDVPRRLGRP